MKIAFIFPGQGSQYAGMGKQIYEQHPVCREFFEKADQILGFSITRLCFEGPVEELQKTINAQPAILTVSIACLKILQENGITPSVAAGHSLGEYSALVAAGAFAFEDAVKLVRKRGQFMQEAVPLGTGGMVAVLGLDTARVIEICQQVTSGTVEVVNFNCPGQVVIAGEKEALEQATEMIKQAGAKRCISLPVSAPFHSRLMHPAGEKMSRELAAVSIYDPVIPVVANVTADYVKDKEEIRRLLVLQVHNPVRWEESMNRLLKDGVTTFIEVGPGNVLTGLIKKISREALVLNTEGQDFLQKMLACLKEVR